MDATLYHGQKVRIIGSRFVGSVGRVEETVTNRSGESMVSVRVRRVSPGVILQRGEVCLVAQSDVTPAK